MAIDVSQKLFDRPQLDGKDVHVDEIDLVIYYGISRAYAEPATAAAVQHALGIKRAIAFDVCDACTGFADAWMVADSMISNRVVDNALLVAGETLTRVAQASIDCINKGENPHEHFASLSFGDGASAAVIRSNASCEKGIFLEVATRETYPELVDACKIGIDLGAMRSRPRPMFVKAGQVFPKHIEAAFSTLGWSPANVDVFITHQASLRAIERAAAQLGGSDDDYHMTFPEFGNIGSVSVPLTLAHYLEENPIDRGERKIALMCYGSGFSAALLVLIQRG
jgi:3-oxoacyl-[acyl-carrier-protein] synthase-3